MLLRMRDERTTPWREGALCPMQSASLGPALGVDSAVDEVEVDRVVGAVYGDLPASAHGVPVVAEGCYEALGERLALYAHS